MFYGPGGAVAGWWLGAGFWPQAQLAADRILRSGQQPLSPANPPPMTTTRVPVSLP
jgi:hypothetical protein